MNNIQLMLSFRDKTYLLHTLKKSFDQLNKSGLAYKPLRKVKTFSRLNLNETKYDTTDLSVGSRSLQASCYDVVSNHERFTSSERMQIEEDDLFKFNCPEIKFDDFLSL